VVGEGYGRPIVILGISLKVSVFMLGRRLVVFGAVLSIA